MHDISIANSRYKLKLQTPFCNYLFISSWYYSIHDGMKSVALSKLHWDILSVTICSSSMARYCAHHRWLITVTFIFMIKQLLCKYGCYLLPWQIACHSLVPSHLAIIAWPTINVTDNISQWSLLNATDFIPSWMLFSHHCMTNNRYR
jgi:hypothetical protein